MSASDVFVVLRAAGERTEAAALALAAAEVGADSVVLVREVPFAAALRRSLEIGAAAGRRWTLCLDADVLLRPGAVAAARAAAEAAPEAAFCVTARVADKLLCQVRPAGQHLYRTALIGKALALGRFEFDPALRRPEAAVKAAMAAAGHPNVHVGTLLGLHDFEQSFADLFRKVAAHTRKHEAVTAEAEPVWRARAAGDADYRFALVAAAAVRAIDATRPAGEGVDGLATDRRRFPQDVGALLMPAGMAEKPPLAAGDIDGAAVERMLAAFEPALVLRPWGRPWGRPGGPPPGRLARVGARLAARLRHLTARPEKP